ncbi:MAG: hypothetical protein JSV62_04675 [Promethearchaeota archaeon]|nr:MAG: hypothetical protein JSV62_04675 [Candidatus Lokiarchaeota archaeon]
MAKKKIVIGSIIGMLAIGSLVYVSYLLLAPVPPIPQSWLENSTLDSPIGPNWFWEYGTEGDNSDIDIVASQDRVDYRILGEKATARLIYGVPNSSTSLGWEVFNNSNFMLPDNYSIRSYGCWVYHFLDESDEPGQVHNFPSIHFRTNISMPVDMSDYIITDASLEVVFNASVDINVDSYNDWDNTSNTPYIDADKFLIGDSANFYVQLSDTNYSYPFRVANFETRDVALGQGDPGRGFEEILNITDQELNYVDKEDLIAALNSALETDNKNLAITLGLDIYCEDNRAGSGGDQDLWNYLIFKSCNLTVTYEKKIDYFTSISLNQGGEEVSGTNIRIADANLNFKYKINDTWPTSAPLSEIRIYLNNIFYDRQTIKLSSANTSFQEVRVGGLDVTDFIDLNTEVNLSIQIFLADNFNLEKVIEISIDDVYIYITIVDISSNWIPVIIGLLAAMIGLTTVFGLYFKIFQYPPMVRKIRRLKKKIKKGRKLKELTFSERNVIIENNIQSKTQILNLEALKNEIKPLDAKEEEIHNINQKIKEDNLGI